VTERVYVSFTLESRVKQRPVQCTSTTCTQKVDFTDIIAKDVMISGLVDDEVKREVLGWHDLDEKTADETVTFVEAKEMARDALHRDSSSTTGAISSYKRRSAGKDHGQPVQKSKCRECHSEMDKLSWSKREKKIVERSLCLPCWLKINKAKNRQGKGKSPNDNDLREEAGAIAIGIINAPSQRLDHLLFDTRDGWYKAESMNHPTLKLVVDVSSEDYTHVEEDSTYTTFYDHCSHGYWSAILPLGTTRLPEMRILEG